jgi:hypothetical protein
MSLSFVGTTTHFFFAEIDMESFKRTQVHEFSFSSYSKQGWKENGLAAFIEHTNRLSRFVAGAILNPKISTERRAKLISRLLSVMESLQARNDFAALMTIYFTLSSTDIVRLKKTWKLVPRVKVDQFNSYDELLSPISNFSGYRELLAFAELPCVPYTAVTTKDMVAAEEMPTKVAAPAEAGQAPPESPVMRINWNKMKTIAKLLSTQISRFWNGYYGATHDAPELVAHLNLLQNDVLTSKLPESDNFHILSDEIEPRSIPSRLNRATMRVSKADILESEDVVKNTSNRGSAPKMSSVIDDYSTRSHTVHGLFPTFLTLKHVQRQTESLQRFYQEPCYCPPPATSQYHRSVLLFRILDFRQFPHCYLKI